MPFCHLNTSYSDYLGVGLDQLAEGDLLVCTLEDHEEEGGEEDLLLAGYSPGPTRHPGVELATVDLHLHKMNV